MKDTQDRAARTAANSLESIEIWARRTCYAAVVTAAMATGTAMVAGYAAWQYYRVTSVMSEASSRLESMRSAGLSAKHAPIVKR
jgi:hypothetical protein